MNRRNFLTKITIALATVALAPLAKLLPKKELKEPIDRRVWEYPGLGGTVATNGDYASGVLTKEMIDKLCKDVRENFCVTPDIVYLSPAQMELMKEYFPNASVRVDPNLYGSIGGIKLVEAPKEMVVTLNKVAGITWDFEL